MYSLLLCLVKTIQTLFQAPQVQTVINCITADDTTVRMRPATGRSQIFTVCDTVQTLHIQHATGRAATGHDETHWKTIGVPSPMHILSGCKAGHVHGAMTCFSETGTFVRNPFIPHKLWESSCSCPPSTQHVSAHLGQMSKNHFTFGVLCPASVMKDLLILTSQNPHHPLN